MPTASQSVRDSSVAETIDGRNGREQPKRERERLHSVCRTPTEADEARWPSPSSNQPCPRVDPTADKQDRRDTPVRPACVDVLSAPFLRPTACLHPRRPSFSTYHMNCVVFVMHVMCSSQKKKKLNRLSKDGRTQSTRNTNLRLVEIE
ncbi:hypothetical protein BLNAU_14877 [Blattamonas nauphoetae]|uniref:Uncharacterized protein n=1 Tax=Blattamonas nauphoetae TaxID=2049346 RepID=A0ABQ9XE11_9EUKA|nr:hypothetical protein BLNAU_14874 [Blattamonas nauphoetae]KAK2950189.1 hypothetical protein BLNAU_14875 [Blattamonas nauphoetae]KAK2950191.1 hypothetical protein BLNAU_14877 [Blattamonas nauphoetae]